MWTVAVLGKVLRRIRGILTNRCYVEADGTTESGEGPKAEGVYWNGHVNLIVTFFFCITAPSGPWPLHSRGF
jgi:hypothetical protein